MKRVFPVCAAVLFALLAIPVAKAQSHQLVPGTQVRLKLLNGLSTSVAHDGDPFTAVVTEPVFSGTDMVLPAGAKIHGTVTTVNRPKMFSMFRGGASMNLVFNSIEVESRIFPAKMSILSIFSSEADSVKRRKDLKTVEGEVIQENRSVKADVETVGVGTAAGSTVGLIFSHVVRGTVFGLAGSGAYVVAKKGKDVELPAQTGLLVRMDSTVALPTALLHSASYTPDER